MDELYKNGINCIERKIGMLVQKEGSGLEKGEAELFTD